MEFFDSELDEVLNIFEQESSEIIQSMDKNLLALEREPNNPDIIIQLARDAHSLKGSARMLGFNDIQAVAHKIEDILGLLKERKLEPKENIADFISESLEHVAMLINKTVANKDEFKTPETEEYIKKLEQIASGTINAQEANAKIEEHCSDEIRKLLSKLNEIEEIIIKYIYIFSNARQTRNFASVLDIIPLLSNLNGIISDLNLNEMSKLITDAAQYLLSLNKETVGEGDVLELNSKLDAIEEFFSSYCTQNEIQTQDYYDEAFKLLTQEPKKEEEVKQEIKEKVKEEDINNRIVTLIDKVYEKLHLLEINIEFLPDIKETIIQIINNVSDKKLTEIYQIVLRILDVYEKKSKSLEVDTLEALKEIFETSRKMFDPTAPKTSELKAELALLLQKAELVEQMSKINIEKEKTKKQNTQPAIEKQAQDWLNTIDSTDIKTLRIDSFKLDKLVNQIGDLIISRIKTNEHLSVAKNIQNELMDWQKSFNKMGYYIKYFDRKYITNSSIGTSIDPRAVIAFNKQLMVLQDHHAEKLSVFIKSVSNLFKQMQENDSKLNSTTNEIEAMVKNMRILPLSTIFQLFPRMVHNIAKDKGKQIEFIVEGADVAADKKIIEEIKIPLIHILRNSIDHGIEEPEERKEKGKNPVGRIIVSAMHSENKVIIQIKDDGRGVDVEKIKKKAVEKGILTPEEIENIDEEQLINLIFYPGFSTGDTVTELSGRGLGLDIVHSKILSLNGRVDIVSQFQKGTVVTIELPATMATVKTFIVLEQNQLYAIATSNIQTVLRVETSDIFERDSKNFFVYNDEVIPVFTLSQILELENKPRHANKYTLMIVKSENSKLGIIVEKLISDQEVLQKKLEPPLFKVKNISGITTLANGEICLILNVRDIFATALPKKQSTKIVAENKAIQMRKNFEHKILVVDDSLTTRTLQKNILQSYGYQVQIATNAPDALVKMQKEDFDLVITDNEMPNMSGYEFVQKIRQNEHYSKIPIIALTSLSEAQWGERFIKAGAQMYMQKDKFNQENFIRIVDTFIKKEG